MIYYELTLKDRHSMCQVTKHFQIHEAINKADVALQAGYIEATIYEVDTTYKVCGLLYSMRISNKESYRREQEYIKKLFSETY